MRDASVNQYIARVEEKPEYIIPCPQRRLTDEEAELVRRRAETSQAIFCELGSGSGGHLIELARRNPQAFCIGFEIRFKRTYRTAVKAERSSLKNLVVVRTKAQDIGKIFGPHTLDAVYVNFPDPWEKRAWLKHRLLTPRFLAALAELLKPGGTLNYKTDHAQYFEETRLALESINAFQIERISRDLYGEGAEEGNIPSEFECLFRSKGVPVHKLLAKKLGGFPLTSV